MGIERALYEEPSTLPGTVDIGIITFQNPLEMWQENYNSSDAG